MPTHTVYQHTLYTDINTHCIATHCISIHTVYQHTVYQHILYINTHCIPTHTVYQHTLYTNTLYSSWPCADLLGAERPQTPVHIEGMLQTLLSKATYTRSFTHSHPDGGGSATQDDSRRVRSRQGEEASGSGDTSSTLS